MWAPSGLFIGEVLLYWIIGNTQFKLTLLYSTWVHGMGILIQCGVIGNLKWGFVVITIIWIYFAVGMVIIQCGNVQFGFDKV